MENGPFPERVLGGRYVLDCLLEKGGMSHIYRAWDSVGDTYVAIKIADPGTSGRDVLRLQREVVALAGLRHPRVVQVLDAGFARSTNTPGYYAALELLDGIPLDEFRAHGEVACCIRIILELLEGLEAVHAAGLVHCDIKPDNIVLTCAGLKIIDFGIATLTARLRPEDIEPPGLCTGTPLFMAPEQHLARRLLDARTDLYACGLTLYFLLTGTFAFPDKTSYQELVGMKMEDRSAPFSASAPKFRFPPGLEDAVSRALRADPDQRYQSADEMRWALRQFI